jgi:hypothetical protein
VTGLRWRWGRSGRGWTRWTWRWIRSGRSWPPAWAEGKQISDDYKQVIADRDNAKKQLDDALAERDSYADGNVIQYSKKEREDDGAKYDITTTWNNWYSNFGKDVEKNPGKYL